jgi:structural maintenance of chromosome 2
MFLIQVTFNREVGCTSVTLEGDSYKPNGLLSGGDRR